jgi:DNA invertase Pin-like site-specific DNA recombinase
MLFLFQGFSLKLLPWFEPNPEFETELRKERQADGIAKALENGVKFGAKANLTDSQVQQMKLERDAGVLIKDLCSKYGLCKASVYRILGG